MKRIMSLVLSAIILFANIVYVNAGEDYRFVYIMAASSATGITDVLELLEHKGDLYIDSNKAAVLSDTEITRSSDNRISFKDGCFMVDYKNNIISYNGNLYCKLKELMDLLRTRYEYAEKSKTLIFRHCTSFYENMYLECKKIIIEDNPENFEVNFLDNIYGVGLATVYNVLKGCRIDYIWGGYQQEQYEKAVANIIKGPESESSLLELVSDGAEIMSDFSTLLDFGETQGVYELFGLPYDDFIEIYDVYNKAYPGTGIKDAAEIAQLIYASKNAYETYVNALYYGIIKDGCYGDLDKAVDYVYSYYSGKAPTALAIFKKVNQNYVADKLGDLVKEGLGIKSVYIKTAGLIFDSLLGMDDMTSAIEQAEICAEIQNITFTSFVNAQLDYLGRVQDNEDISQECFEEAILQMKYSTILYLRACQYAYSKFEFDESLKWCAESWKEKTSEAIRVLAAFDDYDLCRITDNEELNDSVCLESYGELWGRVYKNILQSFDNDKIDNFFNDTVIPVLLDADDDGCPELYLFGALGYGQFVDRVKVYYIMSDGVKVASCTDLWLGRGAFGNIDKYYDKQSKQNIFLVGGGAFDPGFVKERGMTVSKMIFSDGKLSFETIAHNNGLYWCNIGQPDTYEVLNKTCSDFRDYVEKVLDYYSAFEPLSFGFAQTATYMAYDFNMTDDEIDKLFDNYITNTTESFVPSENILESTTEAPTTVPTTKPTTKPVDNNYVQLTNSNARRLLEDAIQCYASCCINGWFGIIYDYSKPCVHCPNEDNPNYMSIQSAVENEYGEFIMVDNTDDYLVTSYNSKREIEAYIDRYLTDGMDGWPKEWLDESFESGLYHETGGSLYFCPHLEGGMGYISYDLSSIEVLNKISDTEYMILIDQYDSGDNYDCTDRMVVKNVNGVFKISSVIDGKYQDEFYRYDIPADYCPDDDDWAC